MSFGWGKISPPPSIDLTLEDDVKCFGSDRLNPSQTESLPHHEQSVEEKTCTDIDEIHLPNHTCNICDKKYRTEASLRWHKEFRHQELTEQTSSRLCTVCGKKFPDLLQFKLHSSSGHKFKCEEYGCIAGFAILNTQ